MDVEFIVWYLNVLLFKKQEHVDLMLAIYMKESCLPKNVNILILLFNISEFYLPNKCEQYDFTVWHLCVLFTKNVNIEILLFGIYM